jgi:hypothetical protein
MTAIEMNRPVPVLDRVNDGRHQLGTGALARESMSDVRSLPEHGIGAFIDTWVNNERKAGATFVMFGPAFGGQPSTEMVDGVQMRADDHFSDWYAVPRLPARNQGLNSRTALP